MESSNLKELKKLVPSLSELVYGNKKPGFIEYKVKSGTCIGFGLHKEDLISVQRNFISNGAQFPRHSHEEVEYLIIYKGKLETYSEDDNLYCIKSGKAGKYKSPIILESGDGVFFQSNVCHHSIALEDTWLIGITIPSQEGYPSA